MGIRKRHVPGCRCCTIPAPPCGVFGLRTDDDPEGNFTELFGDWTYGVDKLFGTGLFDPPAERNWSISGTVAGIACAVETTVDIPWILSSWFRIQTANSAVRVRIAGGAVDVDNYLFAEVYLLPVALGGGLYDYVVDRFAIGQRVSAFETILAQTPFTTGNTRYRLHRLHGGYVYFNPSLCWDQFGTLNGTVASLSPGTSGAYYSESFGRLSFPISKANIASLSGTFSGVFIVESSTEVRFYDYRLRHAVNDTMPLCEACGQSCAAGTAAQEWIVEFADASPGEVEFTDPACTFDCNDILGSYNVPMDNTLEFGDENNAPLGDSLCEYLLEEIDAGNQCSATPYEVSLRGDGSGGDDESSIEFTMYNTANPSLIAISSYDVIVHASQSFAYPIEEIPVDTWFDLDVTTTANTCGATGTLTARAKRVS